MLHIIISTITNRFYTVSITMATCKFAKKQNPRTSTPAPVDADEAKMAT